MLTCELILAAALLTAPLETTIPAEMAGAIAAVRPALLAAAIDAEILDPREKNFMLAQDLVGDLALLQQRYHDMIDLPRIDECQRFPDRKLVNELLALNRAYRAHLVERLAIDLVHAGDIRDAICETDQLYQVWDAVRDAHCEHYYVTIRRQALGLLRTLVGAENFYRGRLPPPIPVWHLPRQ